MNTIILKCNTCNIETVYFPIPREPRFCEFCGRLTIPIKPTILLKEDLIK